MMIVRNRLAMVLILALLGGCATYSGSPTDQDNLCSIFAQRPHWRGATEKTARKWGAPIAVQMAIIKQESAFRADARPPKKSVFFGMIPWGRVSSAYGYSQALDGTWDWYLEDTGRLSFLASRDDFADASDFVGWYMAKTKAMTGVPMHDATSHYLAYHEGQGGFKRRTYLKKTWLMSVSKKVGRTASAYGRQLRSCGRLF